MSVWTAIYDNQLGHTEVICTTVSVDYYDYHAGSYAGRAGQYVANISFSFLFFAGS